MSLYVEATVPQNVFFPRCALSCLHNPADRCTYFTPEIDWCNHGDTDTTDNYAGANSEYTSITYILKGERTTGNRLHLATWRAQDVPICRGRKKSNFNWDILLPVCTTTQTLKGTSINYRLSPLPPCVAPLRLRREQRHGRQRLARPRGQLPRRVALHRRLRRAMLHGVSISTVQRSENCYIYRLPVPTTHILS